MLGRWSARSPGRAVPEAALTVLKYCFLALLYLFLWAVVRVGAARAARAALATPGDAAPAGRASPRRSPRRPTARARDAARARPARAPRRDLPARRRDHGGPRRRLRHRARRRPVRVDGARRRLPSRRASSSSRTSGRATARSSTASGSSAPTRLRRGDQRAVRPDRRRDRAMKLRLPCDRAPPTSAACATTTRTATSSTTTLGLVAVADGMGGHQAGEVASADRARGVAHRVRRRLDARRRDRRRERRRLRAVGSPTTSAARHGHHAHRRRARRRRHAARSATSATRAPTCCATATFERSPSTTASSQELIAAGQLTEAEAEIDPRRSMITRASGSTPAWRSTCTRRPARAATGCCSAPTGSPTCCASDAIADDPRATSPTPTRPRSSSSTRPTRPAAPTTSPCCSSTSRTTAAKTDVPEAAAGRGRRDPDAEPSSDDVTEPVPVVEVRRRAGAGATRVLPAEEEVIAGGEPAAQQRAAARAARARDHGLRLRARAARRHADLPADLWAFLVAVLGLFVVAHLAVRKLAPQADPTLLPLAALLNGFGFVMISRLDPRPRARAGRVDRRRASRRSSLTLMVVRRVRTLERYRYTFLFLGVVALLLPLAPGHRQDDQRRAPLGRHRAAQLPARRGGQGAARRLLRGLPGRQARAARDREPPPRPHDAARPEVPRPAPARVGSCRS